MWEFSQWTLCRVIMQGKDFSLSSKTVYRNKHSRAEAWPHVCLGSNGLRDVEPALLRNCWTYLSSRNQLPGKRPIYHHMYFHSTPWGPFCGFVYVVPLTESTISRLADFMWNLFICTLVKYLLPRLYSIQRLFNVTVKHSLQWSMPLNSPIPPALRTHHNKPLAILILHIACILLMLLYLKKHY